jgi:hypothetical protein
MRVGAAVADATRAPTDAQVIARARTDTAAFATIFDRHHEAIHAYLRRRLDAAIAEEFAAETFARALHGIARYDHDRSDALPWLYGIAANLARRHRRTTATRDVADSYAYLFTKRREIWLSVDRPGLLRDHQAGPVRWMTPRDRENWIAAGRPDTDGGAGEIHMGAIHRYYLGQERLTSAQLRAYDPTPQELFDRLRARRRRRPVAERRGLRPDRRRAA